MRDSSKPLNISVVNGEVVRDVGCLSDLRCLECGVVEYVQDRFRSRQPGKIIRDSMSLCELSLSEL